MRGRGRSGTTSATAVPVPHPVCGKGRWTPLGPSRRMAPAAEAHGVCCSALGEAWGVQLSACVAAVTAAVYAHAAAPQQHAIPASRLRRQVP
jgi:hypothetical protein